MEKSFLRDTEEIMKVVGVSVYPCRTAGRATRASSVALPRSGRSKMAEVRSTTSRVAWPRSGKSRDGDDQVDDFKGGTWGNERQILKQTGGRGQK